jgi:hypothetical protein
MNPQTRTPPDDAPAPRIAWPWMAVALAWAVLSVWGHLPFSLWLVSERTSAWGPWAFRQAVPWMSLLAAVVLCVWIGRGLRTAEPARRLAVLGSWLLWLASCTLVDRWLTFSINEYAHYPQYGLLAWLLARALDARRQRWPLGWVLGLTTMLGVVDETVQYLWTTSSYSHYLDFNDWLVNLLAAWGGVMVYFGFRTPPGARPRKGWWFTRPWRAGALLVAAAMALALGTRHVQISPPEGVQVPQGGRLDGVLYLQRATTWYGQWHQGPRHGRYLVLPPWAGLGLMCAAGLLAAGFGRRPARPGPLPLHSS